ncbi:unannotated protein [freshwater metagenome]|uniref:Unannotated protein n=1 Tax=freshwater metagenome TaxID=449393 RepID=A0A6J7XTY2_9ZZZZ|nr:hypothetical protein [Actinomycetota bacterium]
MKTILFRIFSALAVLATGAFAAAVNTQVLDFGGSSQLALDGSTTTESVEQNGSQLSSAVPEEVQITGGSRSIDSQALKSLRASQAANSVGNGAKSSEQSVPLLTVKNGVAPEKSSGNPTPQVTQAPTPTKTQATTGGSGTSTASGSTGSSSTTNWSSTATNATSGGSGSTPSGGTNGGTSGSSSNGSYESHDDDEHESEDSESDD